ncbi:hypothetical protein LXL04_029492 [Taraxacum kok-saghyz]
MARWHTAGLFDAIPCGLSGFRKNEDGEIIGDETAPILNPQTDNFVEGVVEELSSAASTGKQTRKKRWGDEDDLGGAVMREVENPNRQSATKRTQEEGREDSTDTPSRPPGFSNPDVATQHHSRSPGRAASAGSVGQ